MTGPAPRPAAASVLGGWAPYVARVQDVLDTFRKPACVTSSTVSALTALETASQLADAAQDLRDLLILSSRQTGCTWGEIGSVLGLTPQGAQYQHGQIQEALMKKADKNSDQAGSTPP